MALTTKGGLNRTGGEVGEGEVMHFSAFPQSQNLCADLEAVSNGSVSKNRTNFKKYVHGTQAVNQQLLQLIANICVCHLLGEWETEF